MNTTRCWISLVGGLLLSTLSPVQAQTIEGRYQTIVNGQTTVLDLQETPTGIEGTLSEGSLRLNMTGTYLAGTLNLQLLEPTFGVPLGSIEGPVVNGHFDATITLNNPLTGVPQQQQLRFTKEGTTTSPGEAATEAVGRRDSRLVGTWVHDETISSPGGVGFGAFSTRRTLQLNADGRAQQWVESAGGGGDWSYGGGRQVEFSGQWQTSNDALLLRGDGQTRFEPAGRYRFSEAYLVLEGNGQRFILQRQ